MEIKTITTSYSVSDQITAEDVAKLVEQGVELLVCNRPDGEAEGQPTFAEIAAVAEAAGLEAVHIPFVGGAMKPEHVEAFLPVLKSGKKIHAYCRTGNRSSIIYGAAIGA